MKRLLALVVCGALAVVPALAEADEPPAPASPASSAELAPLLERLQRHATAIEQLKARASYTIHGRMEELDGDGKATHARAMVTKVTATGGVPEWEIVRYVDDGVDKTGEARKKAEERRREKPAKGKRRDFKLPFLASEQPRYVFAVAERDLAANRIRITFVPRAPAEDAYKGSAWVDAAAGEVLTMGFSLSKNPSFIDHVDVTVRFDTITALGRAPSNIAFDARGGFLFIKKRYRGTASFEDAKITR